MNASLRSSALTALGQIKIRTPWHFPSCFPDWRCGMVRFTTEWPRVVWTRRGLATRGEQRPHRGWQEQSSCSVSHTNTGSDSVSECLTSALSSPTCPLTSHNTGAGYSQQGEISGRQLLVTGHCQHHQTETAFLPPRHSKPVQYTPRRKQLPATEDSHGDDT